jgi:hypothetical protein
LPRKLLGQKAESARIYWVFGLFLRVKIARKVARKARGQRKCKFHIENLQNWPIRKEKTSHL